MLIDRRKDGDGRRRPQSSGSAVRWWCWLLAMTIAAGWSLGDTGPVRGQDEGADAEAGAEDEDEPIQAVEKRLLDEEPYYLLVLDEANGNAELKILPPEEPLPANPQPNERLRLELLEFPGRKFDCEWRHIVRVYTFEQLLFREAARLTAEENFNEAFEYYDYLWHNAERTPALNDAVLSFLYANAAHEFANPDQPRFDYSLAILEELIRKDPRFRREEVLGNLSQIAERLIAAYVEEQDFANARGLIDRLLNQYEENLIPGVAVWRDRLIAMANDKKSEAERLVGEGRYREAERVSRGMLKIMPDLEGSVELARVIAERHPMVVVGVGEPATRQEATHVYDWPARRTGRLTQRMLLEFIGAGPEGGIYTFPLGSFEQGDFRRVLYLEMTRPTEGQDVLPVTGYDISRRLLALANPAHPDYDPAWASLVAGVRVNGIYDVEIHLRRPHVLPEAMLQVLLDPDHPQTEGYSISEGPFFLDRIEDNEYQFLANEDYELGTPRVVEVIERVFDDPTDAVAALRRGQVDVLDRVFPADALDLRGARDITVDQYQLPTVHFLVPNYERPFMSSKTFRRAVLYGINRPQILSQEILGNRQIEGYQVISGPFPPGSRENDPLSYAFDNSIEPRPYAPRLAIVLKELAKQELEEIAKRRNEDPPELEPLVLVHPANEMARVSSQAIAQYLTAVGILCEPRELPPGVAIDPDGDYDLLYVQAAMWEPVIDGRRLMSTNGELGVTNEYVGMSLRRLDLARNWREARTRLHELHRVVNEQVAVIPLWQTVDYFAYRNELTGLGRRPVSLYQDVEQWQVLPAGSGDDG